MTQITWWEHEELVSHLASRTDIWSRSEDDRNLWFRTDEDELQCGMKFIPPDDSNTSPYRLYSLQELSYGWVDADTHSYVEWLLTNWTSRPHRLLVQQFLQSELKHDPESAALSAIALEALDWTEVSRSEEPVPPVQEDLWARSVAPHHLVEDHSHLGTYLLSGGTGWLRLRLTGGMLRVQMSIRAKDGMAVPLDGFVRPRSSTARDCAARLAGWPKEESSPTHTARDVSFPINYRCEMHPDEVAWPCPRCAPMIREYDEENKDMA